MNKKITFNITGTNNSVTRYHNCRECCQRDGCDGAAKCELMRKLEKDRGLSIREKITKDAMEIWFKAKNEPAYTRVIWTLNNTFTK